MNKTPSGRVHGLALGTGAEGGNRALHPHPCLCPAGKNPTDEYLEGMMSEAPGPINFTMFLTMFGEKLNGTDPEDVIRNAFACFDEEASGTAPRACSQHEGWGHNPLGQSPSSSRVGELGRGVFGRGRQGPAPQPSHSVPC